MPGRGILRLPGLMTATGTTVGVMVLSGLFGVVSTRALGPFQRGLLATAVVWTASLGSIVAIGLPQAVTFHVARSPERASRFAGTSLVLGGLLGAGLAGGGVAAALTLARPGAELAMAMLFVAIIPVIAGGCGIAAILGTGAIGTWGFLRLLNPLVGLTALVALVLAGGTTAPVVSTAMTGAAVIQISVVLIAMRRRGLLGRPGWREARDLFSYGWRQVLSGGAWLLNYKLDQLVLTVAVVPAALGRYAAASSFGELIAPVAASAGSIMLARTAGGGSRAARDSLPIAAAFCGILVVIGGGLVALFPQSFLDLLFGNRFAGAADVLRILMIGTLGLALGSVLSDTLRGLNYPLDPAKAELAGAVVTAALLAALVPSHGIQGAAVATAISYNLVMVLLVFQVRGRLRQGVEAPAFDG